MRFYLGTNEPLWLQRTRKPLFLSRRRMKRVEKNLPRATCPWALDSGGFSELLLFGHWQTNYKTYAAEVRLYIEEIGRLEWASAQDWMCDPLIIRKTKLSVKKHQELTINNFIDLMSTDPTLPIVPVLQGFNNSDYWRHLKMYERRKIDLTRLPLVGLGGVYRKQRTDEIDALIRGLKDAGLRLHGFGFKKLGLARVADALLSADSLAWSYQARLNKPLKRCQHQSCSSCIHYALRWRQDLLSKVRWYFPEL